MKRRNLISKTAICLYLVLPTVLLTGCFADNTNECLEWINTHPKPIVVHKKSINGITMGIRYTLIDSTSKAVYFDEVQAVLPDTITLYGW